MHWVYGMPYIGPPFKLFELGYPTQISGSASTVYEGIFNEGIYPKSGPVSSSIKFNFTMKNGRNLDLFWMDGGITAPRVIELDPSANMNEALFDWAKDNDNEGGTLFVGTKGKISCGWGGTEPRLLPLSLYKDINVPKKYPRVVGDMNGHWWQWVDACIAGYGNAEVDSPFEGYAGPLTETVLLGNLLLRCFNIREKITRNDPVYGKQDVYNFRKIYCLSMGWRQYEGYQFEPANQFIKGIPERLGRIKL